MWHFLLKLLCGKTSQKLIFFLCRLMSNVLKKTTAYVCWNAMKTNFKFKSPVLCMLKLYTVQTHLPMPCFAYSPGRCVYSPWGMKLNWRCVVCCVQCAECNVQFVVSGLQCEIWSMKGVMQGVGNPENRKLSLTQAKVHKDFILTIF